MAPELALEPKLALELTSGLKLEPEPEPKAARPGGQCPGTQVAMRPIMERKQAESEAATEAELEEALEGALEPEPEQQPAADPLSGLWRASGMNVYDEPEEEFIQLDVSSAGVVTGMVDSDGDGVWTEDDCWIRNGFFDPKTGELKFDQIYDENPSEEDIRTGFDKTTWDGRYDQTSDQIVDGVWSTASGEVGTWSLDRTTEMEMRQRRQRQQAANKIQARMRGIFARHVFVEMRWQAAKNVVSHRLRPALIAARMLQPTEDGELRSPPPKAQERIDREAKERIQREFDAVK